MSRIPVFAGAALLVLAAPGCSNAQGTPPASAPFHASAPVSAVSAAAAPSRITEEWQARVDRGEVMGVVSLILRDGEVLSADSAGWAHRDRGLPMGLRTRVRIASMTKPVTSVAAMILVEEGVLELDAPAARWIPALEGLEVVEPNPTGDEAGPATRSASGPVTVRHLLTHRAGFAYGFIDRGPVGDAYRRLGVRDAAGPGEFTMADNVARLAEAPLSFDPGARWQYGLSTDVLGHLVEVASGQDLESFFRTRIFGPLGMDATGFLVQQEHAGEIAATYTRTPGGDLVMVPGSDARGSAVFYSGGAGLASTALDYARFARMLLGGGELEGVRILRPETVAAMTTSETDDLAPPPLGPGRGFGLGFRVEAGGAFGWDGIYGTSFEVDPASGTVRMLLTQQVPRNPAGIEGAFRRLADEVVQNGGN
ncbi:MAG: class A beta-lactamase-related serine hydrolase [Gemmatimonadales bacterium]|nr:MAG: class A beta-lactamase-related serine hydrolase [Gemmatimonadales bacterium]